MEHQNPKQKQRNRKQAVWQPSEGRKQIQNPDDFGSENKCPPDRHGKNGDPIGSKIETEALWSRCRNGRSRKKYPLINRNKGI